jgi:hypothetical protein
MAKSSNHAISGSGGAYCCRCASAVGDAVKSQPVFCDGEVFCARCFVWKRMNEPSEGQTDGQGRFNAGQACAAKCVSFCGYTMVCFGGEPGKGLRCSHCSRGGAQRLVLHKDSFTKIELEAIEDANRQMLKKAKEEMP